MGCANETELLPARLAETLGAGTPTLAPAVASASAPRASAPTTTATATPTAARAVAVELVVVLLWPARGGRVPELAVAPATRDAARPTSAAATAALRLDNLALLGRAAGDGVLERNVEVLGRCEPAVAVLALWWIRC